jgi:hypothetical protein
MEMTIDLITLNRSAHTLAVSVMGSESSLQMIMNRCHARGASQVEGSSLVQLCPECSVFSSSVGRQLMLLQR